MQNFIRRINRAGIYCLMVIAFGLTSQALAQGTETISAIPASPTSSDPITLVVSGTLPPSAGLFAFAFFKSFAINGSNMRVDICVANSFTVVPPNYQISVPIGLLPNGIYAVESYHAFCDPGSGQQLTTPQLVTTTAFAVAPASAIPTLSDAGIAALALLLSVAGWLAIRKKL